MYEDKFNQLIRNRRSTVTFSGKEVEDETLVRLFEAARWAPSSRNIQPWRFIVGKKSETDVYNKFISCLYETNVEWAQDAPVLILSLTEELQQARNSKNEYALYDAGQSVFSLCIQATHEDVFVHQMGGFDKEKAKELFDIPDGFIPLTMIAVGYLGELTEFPKALMAREMQSRSRKPLQDIVFGGSWGEEFL